MEQKQFIERKLLELSIISPETIFYPNFRYIEEFLVATEEVQLGFSMMEQLKSLTSSIL